MKTSKFNSFSEFYPFYLSEHKKKLTKIYHVIGSILVISIILLSIFSRNYNYLYLTPLAGYGFAWFSHFFIEKNKPATFKYPLYSFIGDWIMFKDILTGRIKLWEN